MQRQAGLEAQRVAGAEPGRSDAGADDRRPQVGGGVRRDGDLDAPLARVAGAGDRARRAVPRRRGRRGTGRRRRPPGTRPPGGRAPPAPARRARPGRAVVSSPPTASRTRSVFDALGITSNTSDAVVAGMPPDDDVVEHRAVGVVEQVGVLGPARGRSCRGRWSASPAAGRGHPAPATCTVPRCETSNTTASCAAGEVLGDRARRVLERHLPAAERHHAGAERRGGRRRAATRSSAHIARRGEPVVGGRAVGERDAAGRRCRP